ncbi:MAG: hypothetical protein PHO26_02315 [Dehalococcoidia bacterium]|nr:hypothetical protein [Dehalococcoidia bacterium]MDD5494985.1 hypothetical protein [Dehalococcoidia bacterium]
MQKNLSKSIRTAIQVMLLLTLIAYGITGYGITEFRTVEALSLGLITKPVAFQIHNNLIFPFIILLLLHIFYKPLSRVIFKST